MKKVLFSLFFISLFMVSAFADYTVDSVTVSGAAATSGRTEVTMTVQLTFDAPAQQVTIPLPEASVTKLSAENYRCKNQTDDQGANALISASDGFSGTQSFTLHYTVPYTPDSDAAADAYTLGILSTRWARPVGSCTFSLTLPSGFEASPEIVSGYHGVLTAAAAGLSTTETTVNSAMTDLMSYDSLRLNISLPEGYFEVRTATVPVISVTWLSVGMLVVLILCLVYWRLKLRTPSAPVSPRLLSPEGILPCQLPTVLDGGSCHIPAMILHWANLGYLSISLSDQKILLLTRTMDMGSERSKAEQVLFSQIFGQKRRVAATPGRFSGAAARFRSASHRCVSKMLFDPRGGSVVIVQTPCRLLLGVGIGYLAYRLLPEGGGFVVLAVLLGIVGLIYSLYLHTALGRLSALRTVTLQTLPCLALIPVLLVAALWAGALPEIALGLLACICSGVLTAPGPRRNQRGVDIMTQTKGCRTFYRHAAWQRLQVFQGRNRRFFQLELPNALALGVARPFAKRFERLPIPAPEWLILPGISAGTAVSLLGTLKPILRQLQEAFR